MLKQTTNILAAALLVSLALMIGCTKSSDKKVADAKTNINELTQDVKDAGANVQDAAQDEWLKFKSGAEAQLAENEKTFADYKAKMTTANGKLKASYNKKIDDLEKKNKELKAKLSEYKKDEKTSWEQFKTEFSHDMDALGTALKDFTVNNTK